MNFDRNNAKIDRFNLSNFQQQQFQISFFRDVLLVSKGLNPISCNDNVHTIPRFRYPLLILGNEAEIDLYRNRSRRCTISRGGVKNTPVVRGRAR